MFKKLEYLYRSFSYAGRALFLFFALICIVSSLGLLYLLNDSLLVETPAHGGSLTEGIIGAPRFINPVLAISDSDHDLTALTYSGLLKATPGGEYVPDLAESYSVSPDGRTYTFKLKEGISFHDGKPVTAEDVVFTVQKVQNPALKSPVRANWDGVVAVASDARTVEFTLKNPYGPFIENATLGILPRHLWQTVNDDEFSFSELNTAGVGSGPFEVGTITRQSGIPAAYELKPFKHYVSGQPYLATLILKFYQSEDALINALERGEIEAASGISPASLDNLTDSTVQTAPLNRVFGVFFNQNQSEVLRDHDVRAALSAAVDRDTLVKQVLGGYGTPLIGPLPPNINSRPSGNQISASSTDLIQAQQADLIKKGWAMGSDGVLTKTTGKDKTKKTEVLAFTLATDNVPELRAAAEYLRDRWQKLGAKVTVQIYDQGDLSQNVIRPRKYDALLFGEVVGREADLYAFWSSSERNDPGLNIALYTNRAADQLLEQLRQTADPAQRGLLYEQFETILATDIPAIFLYTPDFVYSVPNNLLGLDLGSIGEPSDRFLSVANWHRQVDYVWPPFANK